MTNTTLVQLHFEGVAATRWVSPDLAPRVVGLDGDGDLLVPLMAEMPDYLVPLTWCCYASGKGSGGGIVCRACYRAVSFKYGGQSTMAAPVLREEGCERCVECHERPWGHGYCGELCAVCASR